MNLTELMLNNRWCFYLDESQPAPKNKYLFRVCIIVENEYGKFETGTTEKSPWYWDKETCERKNQELGLSKKDVSNIIISSMKAQKEAGIPFR